MITCTLILKELDNGVVAFAMEPNQQGATPKEMKFASVLDLAIKTAAEFALSGSGVGEMIEGQDITAHVQSALKRAENYGGGA